MRILSEFIQEDSKIITIQIGLNEEIEVQVVDGKQDIYSYIVAVE